MDNSGEGTLSATVLMAKWQLMCGGIESIEKTMELIRLVMPDVTFEKRNNEGNQIKAIGTSADGIPNTLMILPDGNGKIGVYWQLQ